jgi:hypothetical protein
MRIRSTSGRRPTIANTASGDGGRTVDDRRNDYCYFTEPTTTK